MVNKKYFQLLLVIVFSFILVFWQFLKIPANLSFDEVEFTKLALSLKNAPFQIYSSLATGHTTPYFYLLLGSFSLFGVNNFALRLPAAIFGVLCPVIFYLVLYKIKGLENPAPTIIVMVLSVILLTSHWYLNFARFAFEATFLLFLELLAIYFLLNKKWLFSALFTALAFYSYLPGRIFFIIPISYLLFSKNKKVAYKFLAVFILLVLPLVIYLFGHSDMRVQELNLLSANNLSIIQKIKAIFENITQTLLMFNFSGDMNGRHNYPGKSALNPILGIFFLFGLVIAFKNFKQKRNFLFLIYFFISLAPSFFIRTQDNPNMLRTFTAIPSVIYFIGLAIVSINRGIFNLKNISKSVLNVLIIVLLLFSSLYELRTYFVFQSKVFKNSFQVKCEINEVLKLSTSIIPKKCWVKKNEF